MTGRFVFRHLSASLIFDLEDGYARRRGMRGPHPRPVGPLSYRVLGRVRNGVLEPFAPMTTLRVRRNPSGYDLSFGVIELPDRTRRTLADGRYAIQITSPPAYYEPVERDDFAVPRPAAPYTIDLEPAFGYPFPTETLPGLRRPTLLRGTYVGASGDGVPGVTVQVPGTSSRSVTDRSGQWVLVFPDDQPTGDVAVRFTAPDNTVQNVPGVPVIGGAEASLRQTALRGWTLTAEGAPLAGTSVAVTGEPAPVRSRPDGRWSYYFRFAQPAAVVDVTASLPDGRAQTHPNVPVEPRVTTVVPTFRL